MRSNRTQRQEMSRLAGVIVFDVVRQKPKVNPNQVGQTEKNPKKSTKRGKMVKLNCGSAVVVSIQSRMRLI